MCYWWKCVCKTWKMKKIDWLQVQGDGISDEYMSENRMAMGNLRWAWQCLTEAMWPKQSIYESIPFGDGGEEEEGLRPPRRGFCSPSPSCSSASLSAGALHGHSSWTSSGRHLGRASAARARCADAGTAARLSRWRALLLVAGGLRGGFTGAATEGVAGRRRGGFE